MAINYEKVNFMTNVGVGIAVVIVAIAGMIAWNSKTKSEMSDRAFFTAWRIIVDDALSRYVEYVPNRQMRKYYNDAREKYDKKMSDAYGVSILKPWEKDDTNKDAALFPTKSRWVTSTWGLRPRDPFTKRYTGGHKTPFHSGIDIKANLHEKVYATYDGVVKYVGRKGEYGKCIIIKHAGGTNTLYAHLEKYYVRKWGVVKQGEVIAEAGNTGRSTGRHLHYEVIVNGEYKNPLAIYY